MDLTNLKPIDIALAVLMVAAMFLLSTDAMAALDMPGHKVVDEAKGWMFGATAITIAVILWAVTAIAALTPQVRQVTFVGLLLVTFGIALWFGAPTYVPLFTRLV